jgi:TupA-like ATPgrasp
MGSDRMMTIRGLRRELSNRVYLALPDSAAVKFAFWRAHGTWPDVVNPRSFSEKVQYRKLFVRDERMPLFADKENMKSLVSKIVGRDAFTPKTYWVGTDVTSLDCRSIRRPFVVKPTHMCDCVRFVRQDDSLDVEPLANECRSWLRSRYGATNREWVYRGIQPRILIEEMVGDGAVPSDYKLWVFGGKVELIQVDVTRFERHERAIYDTSWNKLPVFVSRPTYRRIWNNCPDATARPTPAVRAIPKPATLEAMISVAEKLGAMFDFVRVDLYEHRGRVAVGELTFFPGSGLARIWPESFDLALGEKWSLATQSPDYLPSIENASSTLPGMPPPAEYPELTNSIPPPMTGPGPSIEPPCASMPFTVL